MRTPLAILVISAGALLFARGDDCVQLRADLELSRKRIVVLETENAKLRAELDAAQSARLEREREWLRYTQGIAQLEKISTPVMPHFEVPSASDPATASAPEVPPKGSSVGTDALTSAAKPPDAKPADASAVPPKPIPPAPDPVAAKSHAMLLALRSLFTLEQVSGIDLLEAGTVQAGFTGPVVLRVIDARGRPLGTLSADRLRLEASRAARTLTIVLENGYERRNGVKTPFEGSAIDASDASDADGRGGVRRIVLPNSNPKPWLDAVPELFREEDKTPPLDDGSHDVEKLRAALNLLLHGEASGGEYRVLGIGGVQGAVLRDVAIDVLDAEGRTEKCLFADRMAVLRETQGVQLLLEGGSQVRGDQKTPFLDGRYRIFLPRAAADAWKKAGIPGLIDLDGGRRD
jgi:hypothetical protein